MARAQPGLQRGGAPQRIGAQLASGSTPGCKFSPPRFRAVPLGTAYLTSLGPGFLIENSNTSLAVRIGVPGAQQCCEQCLRHSVLPGTWSDAGLGRFSEVALPSSRRRESDPGRSEWRLGCPHVKSLGPLQARTGQRSPKDGDRPPRRPCGGEGPWVCTPALPLTGCVTSDEFLSRASVSPLENEGWGCGLAQRFQTPAS